MLSCMVVGKDINAPTKSKRQHPSPHPRPPRAFDYFLCPGSGEFDLYLIGVGKIEPEVLGFKWFFFSGAEVANSYKQVFERDGRVWRKR